MNAVSAYVGHYERIPINHFKNELQASYRTFPAIKMPSEGHISYYPIEDIETYGKAYVSIFSGYRKAVQGIRPQH